MQVENRQRKPVKSEFAICHGQDFFPGLDPNQVDLGLDRIKLLMERLGNPHESFRSVHIAGTNGKGSTAAFISTVLQEGGYGTGLYSSPHIERFSERIKIDDNEIAQADIDRLYEEVKLAAEKHPPLEPTYFEFTTAVAFLYFARQNLDIAVIETGLGGRLDATNVITPLVSVITPVAIDHTEYLGSTVAEIAGEKGGVIKSGIPVVVGRQQDCVSGIIGAIAEEKGSPLYLYGRDFGCSSSDSGGMNYRGMNVCLKDIEVGMYGGHQRENASTAIAAVEVLRGLGTAVDEDSVRRGCGSAFMPARFEVVSGSTPIVLDGAHNPGGALTLAAALRERFGGEKGVFVAGFLQDKDVPGIIAELQPLMSELILTIPDSDRAFDLEEKKGYITDVTGDLSLEIVSDVAAAVRKGVEAAKGSGRYLVITGSLYLVGQARGILGGS